jgi:hypothetical protein
MRKPDKATRWAIRSNDVIHRAEQLTLRFIASNQLFLSRDLTDNQLMQAMQTLQGDNFEEEDRMDYENQMTRIASYMNTT